MKSGGSYDDELNELSDEAESGDVDAGKKLLHLFATLAGDPENAHPILVGHVARCVARLLEGKEPRAAFCIQRSGPGAPRRDAQREKILHEYCQARAEGLSDADARVMVVKSLRVTEDQVDKAYKSDPIKRSILIRLMRKVRT